MEETYTPTTGQVREGWAELQDFRRLVGELSSELARVKQEARVKARTVTAEQVEAAARAMWGWGADRSWDSSQGPEFDRYRDYLRRRARAALTAAGFTVPEEEG